MTRLFSTAVQACMLATFAAGAAAPAVAGAAHYRAEPVAAPARERVVARDTMWRCGPSGCSAASSGSRPAIVCALLVREVGPLRSFSVAGRPLAPADLQKCNARAGD